MGFKNDFLVISTTNLSVAEFIDKIENKLKKNGVKIFARINHAQEAQAVGLTLQDEEVIVFGNPLIGTALMIEQPYIGIELPLKILSWRDVHTHKTIIAYQNLEKLAEIFEIQSSIETINKLSHFMKTLTSDD